MTTSNLVGLNTKWYRYQNGMTPIFDSFAKKYPSRPYKV